MPRKIFIAGATVRSAAQSAHRARWEVAAADLFGDRDLMACARVVRLREYPTGILRAAKELTPRKWLYTGGLENVPALVEAVSQRHALLGNPSDVLRMVRDPWKVQRVLDDTGIMSPVLSSTPPGDAAGHWLRKPRTSCGGAHVRFWGVARPNFERASVDQFSKSPSGVRNAMEISKPPNESSSNHCYYQQFVPGVPHGVLYIAANRQAALLGASKQLVGCSWCGAHGFLYAGSIGPIALEERVREILQRIGDVLASCFDLRGIFGVDVVIQDKQVWVLEVNPRFTASVELYERAGRLSAFSAHVAACENQMLPNVVPLQRNRLIYGKAIVFAPFGGEVSSSFCRWIDQQNAHESWPPFVDLPTAGTKFAVGQPIVTAMAHGRSTMMAERQLRQRVCAVNEALTRQ